MISNIKEVADQYLISGSLGAFYKGLLNFFGDTLYPRFNYKIIGTYDKAVIYFKKIQEQGREINAVITPSITLDPSYDINPEEKEGRFAWAYPNLSPGLAVKLFDSIDLKDQNIKLTPVFTKYKGTCEIIFWLSSIYELLDFRIMLHQFSGGLDRICRPEMFWTYIVLPSELREYNSDTIISELDWGNTDLVIKQIKSTGGYYYIHPLLLNPTFKFDSISDSSTKYGGDRLAEYKLSATITYEIALPTYMILSEVGDVRIALNFRIDNMYSKYGTLPTSVILKEVTKIDSDTYFPATKMDVYDIVDKYNETEILNAPIAAVSYPTEVDMPNWNPIFSGTLRYIDSDAKLNLIEKGDIVYFDQYNINKITYIRNARGIIYKTGNISSSGFLKSKILKKTTISDIGTANTNLIEYDGQEVTIDPYRKKIYLGTLDTEKIKSDIPGYGHDILANVDTNTLKQADDNLVNLKAPRYVISSDPDSTGDSCKTQIGEIIDRAIYTFIESDLNSKSPNYLTITNPFIDVIDYRNLYLNSYNGKMEHGRDWILINNNDNLTIKLEPKLNEIIELFHVTF